MKKKQAIIWLFMFFLITGGVLSQGQKPQLFFRFNGNAAFTSAGDFGNFIDINDPDKTTRSYFQGLGGEIGLETKKHAVGISVGYLERYLDTGAIPGTGSMSTTFTRHSFSAVPIFVFFRYKLVGGSFFKASLTLGEGVYLARYREKTGETVLLKSKKNSLGFHGGVTIDLHVFKFLAIFADAGYRLASFKEMAGEDFRYTGTPLKGDLYYQANESTGEYRFFIKRPNQNIPGSRPAALKLNGFFLCAGMKIIL